MTQRPAEIWIREAGENDLHIGFEQVIPNMGTDEKFVLKCYPHPGEPDVSEISFDRDTARRVRNALNSWLEDGGRSSMASTT